MVIVILLLSIFALFLIVIERQPNSRGYRGRCPHMRLALEKQSAAERRLLSNQKPSLLSLYFPKGFRGKTMLAKVVPSLLIIYMSLSMLIGCRSLLSNNKQSTLSPQAHHKSEARHGAPYGMCMSNFLRTAPALVYSCVYLFVSMLYISIHLYSIYNYVALPPSLEGWCKGVFI